MFVCCTHVSIPDIPDDEAQYWTGKLERINTMRIHDEVKLNVRRFYYFSLYYASVCDKYTYCVLSFVKKDMLVSSGLLLLVLMTENCDLFML